MSMQFDDPMNEKTREFIEETFGPGVPMDERTALVSFRHNLVDRELNRKIANIAEQPLTLALLAEGETKTLSDGTVYQVTPQGWRKLEPLTFRAMSEAVIEAQNNGFDEAIFVGRVQCDEILAGARRGIGVTIDNGQRIEFNGLPVYVVDAENYFRVA